MNRFVTALSALTLLVLFGTADAGAQALVFHGGPSAYDGAPNVPHIFMWESLEADTLFWGSYGFTPGDETDREYAYWYDWEGDPHQGEGALMLDWSLWTDQSWGGSNALQHFLPDTTDRFYDFSDFTHLHLWYNTQVPADPPTNFRLKLHDASEGLGTAPTSETEDWYSESGTIYQAQPGWKVYAIPLQDLGTVTPGSGGFSRPGCPSSCWSGIWGNGKLDLDKISGFQLEFTAGQLGPAADSMTAGTIVFDNFYATGVRYDLLQSFDNGTGGGGSWVNGSGTHTTAALPDTVQGTGSMQLDYHVIGDLDWGGSVDVQVMPSGGSTFPNLADNTHISLFYKVLEPIQGNANLVVKLFNAATGGGIWWEQTAPGVLSDESGKWQRLLLPISEFKMPSWQNPPAGTELNLAAVNEMQLQLIGGSGANATGSIIFDRMTTYGEQETDFEAPDAVTGISVTPSDFANVVSWQDVSGENDETYDIYFSTSPITDVTAEGVMVAASDIEEDTEVFVHSLYAPLEDQSVSYYYAMTATDRAGNVSDASPLGTAVTNMAKGMATISLAPPANFVADGDISEWTGIMPFHVEPNGDFGYISSGFVIDNAQDLSADVYVAADDEALYFAFDVTDNFVAFEPEDPSQHQQRWEWDNLEVFIGLYDWRGPKHEIFEREAEPDYQFNFYGTEARSNSVGSIYPEGHENFVYATTDKGYVMEVKLPYDVFAFDGAPAFSPKNGMRIPFNFKIHDDDSGTNTRQGALVWSFDDEDNAHVSPENWFYTWIGDRFSVGIEQIGSEVPRAFALEQNYPNPFNPSTIIRYQLPHDGVVTLKVFDVLGKEVMTLVDSRQTPGTYEVTVDASSLPSGVYFYQLRSGRMVQAKSMMLVR